MNITDKQRDEQLKAAGVHLLPWVGSEYENGINYDENGIIQYGTPEKKGKRVLVLGESHYCARKEDVKPDLTRNIIKDFIDPNSKFEPYKNTYTKLERALAGKSDIEKGEREMLWKHVIFYNYVQEALTAPRFAPCTEQFIVSEEAFWEVLSLYNPDIVICCGKRLYINLPQQGMQGEDVIIENGEYETETWVYTLKKKEITLLSIHSPSSAFEPFFWHEFIVKLFYMKNNG